MQASGVKITLLYSVLGLYRPEESTFIEWSSACHYLIQG